MTKEEVENLRQKYGITCEQRTVYFWKTYKYEKLEDAVNYAERMLPSEQKPLRDDALSRAR